MIGAALAELDLGAMLAALREQETRGHTAETDGELRVECFGETSIRLAGELRDVLHPGDRQNLDVAYRRAARLAAYAIATQRRIRTEQERTRQKESNTHERRAF